MKHRPRYLRAFTLIELMMVIAIIALLLVILMPVFASARQAALKTAAMGQMQQLGLSYMLYAGDFDSRMAPATNYGVPETAEERLWTNLTFAYTGRSENSFVAKGSDGRHVKNWADRGWASIGLNNATSLDPLGCLDEEPDKTSCQAFTSSAVLEKSDRPAFIPLFAVTPHGPTDQNYRGYEFAPYNGLPNPLNPMESPPLVSERDLVQELLILPGDFIKAVFARYSPDGLGNGQTPIVFGDGHARTYRARQIQKGKTGILWRFR